MKLIYASLMASCALIVPFGDIEARDPNEILPTVEIKSGKGTVRINASDYQEGVHELADPEAAKAVLEPTASPVADPAFAAPASPPASGEATPPAPGAAAPTLPPVGSAGLPPAATNSTVPNSPSVPATSAEQYVTKFGTGKNAKFFVTDDKGTKLEAFGPDGFDDEAAARAAITAKAAPAPTV